MSLDPTIQPIVDLVNAAAAERPPIAEQTVEERRAGYHALVAAAGEGPALPEVVESSAAGIPIRIYRPTVQADGSAGGEGINIFFHGGGWVIGDLDSHDEVCRQLAAQSGAVTVSVGYRLAPEARFPAAIDDAWAAFEWIAANRSTIGSGEAKIVVSGDSAGGNLAAVVALMARDAGLELAAQLLIYPSVNMDNEVFPSLVDNAEGYVLTAETMQWFRQQYFDPDRFETDRKDWRAAPLQASSHAGLAPALIITAQYDPLRDEGAAYADALRSAGVDVTHRLYEGMVHIFFQLGPIVPKGAEAVAEVAAAVKKYCAN